MITRATLAALIIAALLVLASWAGKKIKQARIEQFGKDPDDE